LSDDGLVTASRAAAGVGRPTQLWALTPAAQARFPDTHAALTVQLLDLIQRQLGTVALDTIIAAREAETATTYAAAIGADADLRERVAALAALRSQEGYMAAWTEEGDGSLLLVENHCPICAAATACQGFCRAELEVFRAILGDGVEVERTDHIVSGGRRCSYTIRPIDHAAA
jgi:predicted ArsR family transcriptional regulator